MNKDNHSGMVETKDYNKWRKNIIYSKIATSKGIKEEEYSKQPNLIQKINFPLNFFEALQPTPRRQT